MSESVSIVIPMLDAGAEFEELLRAVQNQSHDFDLDVLVIDSGSTDGTPELAESYGATVHTIDRSEFNHGATRNLGISMTEGEYVVMLVQDALPADARWLASLVGAVASDGAVAGAYSRQVARPEADPVTRALVGGMSSAKPERQVKHSDGDFAKLPPPKRRRLAAFDNVSSCVRRSVWEEFPFETERFGEDIRFGKAAIEAGYTLVYEPESVVVHSHERGAMYDLKRYYADQKVLAELFDLRPTGSIPKFVRGIIGTHSRLYPELRGDPEISDWPASLVFVEVMKFAVVSQLGNYLGAKSSALKRVSPALYARMDGFLGRGV